MLTIVRVNYIFIQPAPEVQIGVGIFYVCVVFSAAAILLIRVAWKVFTIYLRCWCRFYEEQQSIVNFGTWTMNQNALWQLKSLQIKTKPLPGKMATVRKRGQKNHEVVTYSAFVTKSRFSLTSSCISSIKFFCHVHQHVRHLSCKLHVNWVKPIFWSLVYIWYDFAKLKSKYCRLKCHFILYYTSDHWLTILSYATHIEIVFY